MIFIKYICKNCFKLFSKRSKLGVLTTCPHCYTSNALESRGAFERKQPCEKAKEKTA